MANDREELPRLAIEDAATLDGRSFDQPVPQTLDGATPEFESAAVKSKERVSVADANQAVDPARIGRYVVLRRLGQGGMGVVYSGYDADLDRKVAIKVVRNSAQNNSIGRARVLHEAQAMARIAHPNVVHVYEVGQDENTSTNQVFIAMEFVAGLSLADWQRQHRASTSIEALVRLYVQAAAGLEAAHQKGLIHRDFKPDNVLVGDDGRARVVDFGLARALAGPTFVPPPELQSPRRSGSMERLTEAGSILGTPGYMAPEQVRGGETDARSDQFSFCVALYEALYQQLPFAGDTFEEFSHNVLAGNVRPLPSDKTARFEVPIVVEKALRRGLSPDPAARFPSMQSLIAALSAGLDPDSDSSRSRQRKRLVNLTLTATLLSVVGYRLNSMRGIKSYALLGLQTPMIFGWIMFFCIGMTVVVLRKSALRQPRSRRLMYFAMLIGSYFAVGRTIGYLTDIKAGPYHIMETVALAALFAAEIPYVGKQYAVLVVVCLISVLLRILLPEYAFLHANLAFGLLIVLALYLRPWTSQAAAQASEES